jgi:hypothetical protein
MACERALTRIPAPYRRLLADAMASGAVAAVCSTAVLTLACRHDGQPPATGTNATSHWIWGRAAWYSRHSDLRHTVPGYLIHHASSVWWACFFEAWNRWRRPRRRSGYAARAASIAALAAAVDYLVVPKRLTPGFEAHLRPRAIALVYAAFAAGLALATTPRTVADRRGE